MSFLAPWALGLAALAAVPVALHLLRRETRQRMAFPAIRYLRRAVDRSARALKLRDRLLLLVRAGLVASLGVAAAAPLVGSGEASDHAPTDLVLLLDNTASMNRLHGGVTLLDRQRSRAFGLLDAARAGDRFWVLPAVGPLLAAGVQAGPAGEAVARVQATDGTADLAAVVREAVRILPTGAARPREIVVMSDFQATAIPGPPLELPDDIRLWASLAESDPENTAVADVLVEPPVPGDEGTVIVRLTSTASRLDTLEIRLGIGGEAASISRVGADGTAVIRLPDPGTGEHVVTVEIPPSGLRSDDRRSFVLRMSAPPTVGHSGPADSYVAQALATLERAGRLRRGDGSEPIAAWFSEGVPPAGIPANWAKAWILAPPAEDDLLARFNAGLDRLGVPWRVDATGSRGGDGLAPAPEVPGLESIRARALRRLRAVGVTGDSVLVRTVGGEPWLIGGRTADRSYLLFASPLLPDFTELPVTAAMLPLLETALFRWAGLGGSLPDPTPAGTSSILPAAADSVFPPTGAAVRVDGGGPYVPLLAGVHRIHLSGGDSARLVANVPAPESDLAPAAEDEFMRVLGSEGAVVARSEEEWRAGMFGSRRGSSLSPFLVALALALVVLEAALATPGEKAARPEPARSRVVSP